ncbi:hypothetical protein [Shumkonia mesophila]|uniref:hypothetical protein n=1 Tax=Shumkonia mesophila TaxID=2838854 RepID=UPI0029349506|nr:hypothetical protein [Shumkonia mesophila]
MAAQLGRLDLVSVLLAIVAILLAIGGFVAFFNVRGIARRHAEEEAREVAEKAANDYLQREMPLIIKEYGELFENAGADKQADEIAEAQEKSGGGEL